MSTLRVIRWTLDLTIRSDAHARSGAIIIDESYAPVVLAMPVTLAVDQS